MQKVKAEKTNPVLQQDDFIKYRNVLQEDFS